MARRKKSSGGDGCLGSILVFSVLIAVVAKIGVYLLIGGAIFGVIYLIVKAVSSSSANTTGSSTTSSNVQSFQSSGSSSSSSISTRSIPAESIQPQDNEAPKISQFIAKYKVAPIPFPAAISDPLQKEMEAFQCLEVLQTVNRVVSQRNSIIKELHSIQAEIEKILACPESSSDREKMRYLKRNESTLKTLKEEYDAKLQELSNKEIGLLSKHIIAFDRVRNTFSEIGKSKKTSSTSGVSYQSFLKLHSSIPGNLFVSQQDPMEMNFGAYRFFLLPDVILAFDRTGTFVSAFEPCALNIKVYDRQRTVQMRNSNYSGWTHSDSLIAEDSVRTVEGMVRTTWLHTKKDGGPDLRYSYNPSTRTRTDYYTHGEVVIQIGRYQASFLFSAGNMASRLNAMVPEYCSILHELNTVPSLLRLLEASAKKKDPAQELLHQYENLNENIICRVI